MTDPLTAKELVQKSYEYVDKLCKECTKSLMEEYNKNHKKFQLGNLASELSTNICQWFEKREKNIRLTPEAKSANNQSSTQIRMKFNGTTKDSMFSITASIAVFVPPGVEISDKTVCFPKSIVLSADKSNFERRKE